MLTQAHLRRKTASAIASRSADLHRSGQYSELAAEAIFYYAPGLKPRVLADQQRRREVVICEFLALFCIPFELVLYVADGLARL